jgi:hypothetical protein
MAGGEISKALSYLPAEQGWVPTSISISLAQPVRLVARAFSIFDSKKSLSTG